MGIPDRHRAGRSKLVPYHEGEPPADRHARRLQANVEQGRTEVERWCEEQGVGFEVKNGGHHWIFRRGDWIAEWWPSSAKLVVQRCYGDGMHVHDWKQAMRLLARGLRRAGKGGR